MLQQQREDYATDATTGAGSPGGETTPLEEKVTNGGDTRCENEGRTQTSQEAEDEYKVPVL